MPGRARVAIERAVRLLHETGGDCEMEFRSDYDALHCILAHLIQARPEQIAITRGTAHGLSLCARGLDWRHGDNIVGAQLEYPTNLLPWMALESRGVELRLVVPDEGRVTPERVFALIDDRTRVVALSLVQFWNGFRLDVSRIGAECRRRGIKFVVDGAQAVGAVGIDVDAARIDLLAAGACKWLLGPVGVGFCYIHPELLRELDPPLIGVGSVAEPDAFRVVLAYATTARRFEESDLSWLDVAGFLAGVQLIEEIGIETIEDRVVSLSTRLGNRLSQSGFELAPPWPRSPNESSGIVSFRRSGIDPADDLRRLENGGVIGRVRGEYVRLSPHFYNTDAEMERVLSILS